MDTIDRLIYRIKIAEVINRLFVETDNKNWDAVKSCFESKVHFDMESVGGGPATKLTPKEITGGWNEGLKNIEKLHHQIGNLTINVNNKSASATCYGIAIHYRNLSDSENTRTFVGSYEFHLNKGSESWKISSIKFNLKFITGNLELG